MARTSSNGATLGFVHTLWAAADKLPGHLDAAEVLGNEALAFVAHEDPDAGAGRSGCELLGVE